MLHQQPPNWGGCAPGADGELFSKHDQSFRPREDASSDAAVKCEKSESTLMFLLVFFFHLKFFIN